MNREQELDRLLHEMEGLRQSKRHQSFDELKLIEIAAARLGMYASYAYRILDSPFVAPVERIQPRGVRFGRVQRVG